MGQKNEKPARAPTNPQNNAVQTIGKLKKTQRTLEKREEHLQTQIKQCVTLAREKMKKKDKRGALYQLKRKKMLTKRATDCQNMKLNLEQQIFTLENMNTNKEIVGAMGEARDTMTRMQQATNIDKIDTIREDLDEATARQEEITDMLAEPIGDGFEEDELEDELAELESEMGEEDTIATMTQLPDVPASRVPRPQPAVADPTPDIALPAVPTGDVRVPAAAPAAPAASTEDAELAELEAMMA